MALTKISKQETEVGPSPQRRRFLSYLWAGLGIAALVELFWVVGSFLRPRPKRSTAAAPSALMDAGQVDAFGLGTVTAFPRGRFYLVRLTDGGFLALSRRCPHLGCTLPWMAEAGQFVCPCHSSAFDMHGDVLRSPAPRAMAMHPVVIENQMVRVDTARVEKRDRFRKDQAVYPKTI